MVALLMAIVCSALLSRTMAVSGLLLRSPMRWRRALGATAALALGACAGDPAEPSGSGTVYQLVAVDSVTTGHLACFAHSVVFDESGPVGPGECSVDLRSLSAYFDSTLAAPELVVRAGVRVQGDTATWEARYRATIRNGALVYGPGTSGPGSQHGGAAVRLS